MASIQLRILQLVYFNGCFFTGFSIMDDSDDVVVVLPSDFTTSYPKKRRRTNVIPHDVIEIDEDVMILDVKVGTSNKGKEILTEYNDISVNQPAQSRKKPASTPRENSLQAIYAREMEEDKDGLLKKYRLFKRFDTVGDYSDHHYAHRGSKAKQPPKNWAKVIQQEWKILEKDLPDTISVRVYEERMDLLRAVIVGAAGTPYQDGLFFFDVFFPSNYPNVPPNVYYHSGGLRLNPNLYECGKVCLSLLNTWSGSKEEKWTPKKSTMLQVLLSIQALVLNAKPYFNEPGWASMAGTAEGEKRAQPYHENIFILSCRTMLFSLRKPPKHFEDYVAGHFRARAQAILLACKAYMEGANVGCLAEGGVQDIDESDKSCSHNFKQQVGSIVKPLVDGFVKNGSNKEFCKQLLPKVKV
ncbi:(E3-independent) E2 ubiquitin-conjugating enzyme [Ranunculus cassubicifolius]